MNIKFTKIKSPVMEKRGTGFESKAVYNPSVIIENNTIYMLYRAESLYDKCSGKIGLAWSKDGIHFQRKPKPVLFPEYDYEKMGCEDPRIVKFNNTFYMFYVANRGSFKGIHIALASSNNLINWNKHGLIKMDLADWDSDMIKAGSICPVKINDKYIMYFLGQKKEWNTSVGLAFSDDLITWKEYKNNPVIIPRNGMFDCKGVEPGTTFIDKNRIILCYNGWAEDKIHKTGLITFLKHDPARIVSRSENPVLEPEYPWEINGYADKVVFAEGIIEYNDYIYLYYGAADNCIGLAKAVKVS